MALQSNQTPRISHMHKIEDMSGLMRLLSPLMKKLDFIEKAKIKLELIATKMESLKGKYDLVFPNILENTKRCRNYLKFVGSHTTSGGTASEDITVENVTSDMRCMVMLKSEGETPVSIKSAECGTNKITITFSADPADDHELTYIVY